MIPYAEQVGFQTVHIGSASPTIGLITAYGVLDMKMRRRVAVLRLSLVVLYSSLFMILHNDDYALLIGSTLAFVVLAATMYVTSNEEWYDPNVSPSKSFLTWSRTVSPRGYICIEVDGRVEKMHGDANLMPSLWARER